MKRSKGLFLLPAAVAAFVAGVAGPARAADPTTADCLSANDASISLRNQHKLRAARAQLLVCAASTCPADIRTECTRRVTDINGAMPTIVFEAKDPAGNDLSAVKVTIDGQVIAERLEGTALSIDPGDHTFTFETAGQPAVQKSFVIREAEKERRERIQFGTPVAPPAEGAEGKAGAGATTTIVMTDTGDSGKKTAAFIVGGIGIAGLIAGGAVLGLALSLKDKSTTENTPQNPKGGDSDYNAALQDQTIAYVIGGVGIAALGTGVVLLLTSGGKSSTDTPKPAALRFVPDVAPGHAGLGLVGTF